MRQFNNITLAILQQEISRKMGSMNKMFRIAGGFFVIFIVATSLISTAQAQTITFYHSDALGSPIAATDENGDIKWREMYNPYGEKLVETSDSSDNTRGYTGHSYDEETKLTYAGARYYDPVVGRFYATDPVSYLGHINRSNPVHGFNRYAYANNNPYKYTDPDGELAILATVAIGAVAGAVINAGVYAVTTKNFSLSKFGAKALSGALVGGLTGLGAGAAIAGVAAGTTTTTFATVSYTAMSSTAGMLGTIADNVIDGTPSTVQNLLVGAAANTLGGHFGKLVKPWANAMTTVTTRAVKGLSVKSLTGRIFHHGGQSATIHPSKKLSKGLEDASGELFSSGIKGIGSCVGANSC